MIIQHLVSKLIPRPIALKSFVDSKTLFDVIAKEGRTTENPLLIDNAAVHESYETGELGKVRWIPGRHNPGDGLKNSI